MTQKSARRALLILVGLFFSSTVSGLVVGEAVSFRAGMAFVVGNDPVSVAVGDFNGDGKPDLAVANYDSTTVQVLLGNGDGTFRTALTFGAGSSPRSVAVGDFNGDGEPDLAVANSGSNTVSELRGASGRELAEIPIVAACFKHRS